MIKYAKITDGELGLCEVGTGTNTEFYKSIGMSLKDVEQSEKDNKWYLTEKCPHYTPEEIEEQQREQRKLEVQNKIKELNEYVVDYIRIGDQKEIDIINNIILGLENSLSN